MTRALLQIAFAGVFASTAVFAQSADPLAGPNLYADVERYAAFGIHRFGTSADRDTTDWIAHELKQAGFAVEFQSFTLAKQYSTAASNIRINEQAIPALPFWWPPPQSASLKLRQLIADDSTDTAQGRIVWIKMPFDGSAYLSDRQRQAIALAAQRSPAAIIVTIDSPSEEEYAYNVSQTDAPWPVPVLIVGSKYVPSLDAARNQKHPVEIVVQGRYESNVAGRNVVARLDRKASRTIVISTPMTGWFTCACERGSGIAVFLGVARWAARQQLDANLVFVATAGHEIGHGGMEVFIKRNPPAPETTSAWIHIGSSVACYEWQKSESGWATEKTLDARRTVFFSSSMAATVSSGFDGLSLNRVVTDKGPPPGELREVQGAGYQNFLGIAAGHRFFHSPDDTPRTTGPEAIEPVARAFSKTLEGIAGR
jgi:hypothetical protein